MCPIDLLDVGVAAKGRIDDILENRRISWKNVNKVFVTESPVFRIHTYNTNNNELSNNFNLFTYKE